MLCKRFMRSFNPPVYGLYIVYKIIGVNLNCCYFLEYFGYIVDVGIADISKTTYKRYFQVILKCHPAFSLSVMVTNSEKGIEQDFRTAMDRKIPIKLVNLYWWDIPYYNDSSEFEECADINFSVKQTLFMGVTKALKFPDFRANIEGHIRWKDAEEQTIWSKKFRRDMKKKNAWLVSGENEQECVIWERYISEIDLLLGSERETFVRITNVKQNEFEGVVRFETTYQTIISDSF